ncbi:DUF6365 family protein [Arthrobacter sp. NA-172]|uniref:DUF6365 family protein n=1 Tax=Arthrobacter sp. NA-172 TaxID=3367524 RepID=UPI0037540D0A
MNHLEQSKPDGLVLADHHLFALEKTSVSLDALLGLGRPAVALDSLCLGPAASRMQMALSQQPSMSAIHRWFKPETTVPPLPSGVPLMRPVPVSGLGRREDAFNLYGDLLTPDRPKAEVFRRLGVSPDRALIVVAQSSWAISAYGLLGRVGKTTDSDSYRKLRRQWFSELFNKVGQPVTVVEMSSGDKSPTRQGTVDFLPLSYQPMGDFADILSAADLYLTDNLTSGAMAKAAAMRTPVLALVNERNERSTDAFSNSWFVQMEQLFPGFGVRFLVNPFGWVDELRPLLDRNDYLNAVPRTEIYDLDASARAVGELLSTATRPASDALARQLRGLPLAADMLAQKLGLDFAEARSHALNH